MFFLIFFQMLALAILIMTGYYIGRRHLLDDHSMGQISYLIGHVFNPMLMISASLSADSSGDMRQWLIVLAIAFTVFVVLILLSYVIAPLFDRSKGQKEMFQLMLIFGNLGYMGIPVVKGVYGESYTFYVLAFMMCYNFFYYTFAMALFNGGLRKDSLRGMLNPGTISGIVAIFIVLFHISLPAFLATSIDYLGGLTSPLAMLAVGYTVSQSDLRAIFTNVRIIIFTILRMILLPLLCIPLLKLLPLSQEIIGVCLIEIAMPVGNLILIGGTEKGIDCTNCSASIIMTTLLSVITLPLLILFL